MPHVRYVLDNGSVELVDQMGDDYSILRAARVSTGSSIKKGDEQDRRLIRYLYRNKHISPFAFASFQFYIKCPIFVARQWFRHRTFDMNEASGRYKAFEWEVYYPDEWKLQNQENKQGSEEALSYRQNKDQEQDYSFVEEACERFYNKSLEDGISRELSRLVMPVGHYTEFYAHVNLRNLFHFLELRLDAHAQYEIRVYAEAILSILEDIDSLKWSVEAFKEYYALDQAVQNLKEHHKNDVRGLTQRIEQLYVN